MEPEKPLISKNKDGPKVFRITEVLSKQSRSMNKIIEDLDNIERVFCYDEKTGDRTSRVPDLKTQLERAKDIEKKNQNLLEELDALKDAKIQLEVKLFEKETSLSDLDLQLDELKSQPYESDTLTTRNNDLERKLAEKKRAVTELTKRLDDLDSQPSDLDALTARNHELEKMLAEKEAALSDMARKLEDLKSKPSEPKATVLKTKKIEPKDKISLEPPETRKSVMPPGKTFPRGVDIFIEDIRQIKEDINIIMAETEREIRLYDDDSDIRHFEAANEKMKKVLTGVFGQVEACRGILSILPNSPTIERRYFDRLKWALDNPYSSYLSSQIQAFEAFCRDDAVGFAEEQELADTHFSQYEKSLEETELLKSQILEKYKVQSLF